jgi:hypothetical protein
MVPALKIVDVFGKQLKQVIGHNVIAMA